MTKTYKTLAIIAFGALSLHSASAQNVSNTVKLTNFSELQQHFHYQDNKPVIISGHRGGMLPGFPENIITFTFFF